VLARRRRATGQGIRFWLLMQSCWLPAVPPQLAPLSSEFAGVVGGVDGVQEAARSDKAIKLQRARFEKFICEKSFV
jgi:hypothetical protein